MDMLDVHHIAIYDDLIAAKVQGCTHVSDAPSGDHPRIMKNIAECELWWISGTYNTIHPFITK